MEKPLLKITFKEPEILKRRYGKFTCNFIISNKVCKYTKGFIIDYHVIEKEKIKSIEFIQPNEL